MAAIPSDLRDAVRTFRHRPGFSLLAVLTLAVGMSVNTVAFSVVNSLIFKPPPYANAKQLGWIFISSPGNPEGGASIPQYETFRARAASVDSVVAEGRVPLRLTRAHRVDQIWALVVSGNYFEVLGARAERGRLLSKADGAAAVVSHQFWARDLGEAPPGGATIVINDIEVHVVGVLPAGFHGPGGIYAPDVWVSLDSRKALGLSSQLESPAKDWLTVVGRLRNGVAPAQAAAELTSLLDSSEPRSGARGDRRRARFVRISDGHPEARAIARIAAVGMTVVGMVLLIACFNVAGLFVTRATERRREMAVRSALGASGWRLIRQMMTEAMLFASLAGLLALAMSAASGRLLSAFSLPAPIPQQIDLSPDARTVLFTLCMILVATVLPAMLPALRASRLGLQQVLSAEAASATGGRRCRTRRAFQVLQIAGSTMFLALAVLFVGSFRHMLAADLGFDTRNVLVITADPQTHGRSAIEAEQFFKSLAEGLRGDPRVRASASTTGIPYTLSPRGTTVGVDGQDCRTQKCEAAQLFVVDSNYLDVMGIKLLHGRNLSDADRAQGGGVLVSRTTAEKLWPGKSPLGRYVTLGPDREMAQVAGIVSDVQANGVGQKPRPHLYRAIRTSDYATAVTMVVGTSGEPAAIAETVRERAASINRALPLQSVQSMQEHLRVPLWPARVAAWFLGVCSSIALVLATVGLFGVISYTVAQRSREFGIRMAIGAGARSILTLVLKEGAILTAAGTLVGLAIGAAAGAAVHAVLVGVSAGDPRPYLLAGAIQAVVAIFACAYPAVKATRVDPIAVIHDRLS